MKYVVLLFTALLMSSCGYAAVKTPPKPKNVIQQPLTFKVGEDYELIEDAPQRAHANNQIEVIEFFSYGCPACYYLEPALEKWIEKQPKTLVFHRVPVIFEPEWKMYAKAFYIASAMDINEKVTPDLFKAIQEKHENLQTPEDLKKFFTKHGVSSQDFDSAFNFSPRVDAQINHSLQLMQQYKITEIPTAIIANKYKTTGRMARKRDRFIAILDFLVAKEQASAQRT